MSRRLLVVDDDPLVREVVKDYLAQDGWEVTSAATGAEGLVLAQGGGFDAALFDVMLPDGDGSEFCRWLKSSPKTDRLIIFLMSGHRTRTDDKINGLEHGAIDYVTKPLELEELRVRLNAVVRALRAAAPRGKGRRRSA